MQNKEHHLKKGHTQIPKLAKKLVGMQVQRNTTWQNKGVGREWRPTPHTKKREKQTTWWNPRESTKIALGK
jgi:hypothetical protein